MSNKTHLKVLNNNTVLENTTCFATHAEYNVSCQRKKCNNWFNNAKYNNCIIIASSAGPRTLQDVGDFFNLTRMRICQIEKNIREKIKIED